MSVKIIRLNPYPFKNSHAFILGVLTPITILLLFYAFAIYINGVNENYFKIFCQIKSKDAAN
tara:strand:- start:532 stop:717 length:186 start_codon:yes stop_codon:yes gene_type:complete